MIDDQDLVARDRPLRRRVFLTIIAAYSIATVVACVAICLLGMP